MPLRTVDHFDGIAKTFHWVMAILMIMMVIIGLRMTDMPNSPDKFMIYSWHKAFGMTILGLAVARLLWRLHSPRPRPLPTHRPLELLAAHIVHVVLYATLFLMPISGYVMTSAAGRPFAVWGWPVPLLIKPDAGLAGFAREAHELISNVLIGAFVLHVAGALKHHILDKDETLIRMLPSIFAPRKK